MMPHYQGMTARLLLGRRQCRARHGPCRAAGALQAGAGRRGADGRVAAAGHPGRACAAAGFRQRARPSRAIAPAMTREQRIRGADGGVDWALLATAYSASAPGRRGASRVERPRVRQPGRRGRDHRALSHGLHALGERACRLSAPPCAPPTIPCPVSATASCSGAWAPRTWRRSRPIAPTPSWAATRAGRLCRTRRPSRSSMR